MDAQLKAKWVEALRSGEYKQCRNMLADGNGGLCCLGVLCVISGKPVEGFPMKDDSYTWTKTMVGSHFARLTEMNDRGQKSFPRIADYIEENL